MLPLLILALAGAVLLLVGMAQSGFTTPTSKTLISGTPLREETKLTTGTDCYPGRLVGEGATDADSLVCTQLLHPKGFISYEDTHPDYQPATIATAFAANAIVGIIHGDVVVLSKLAAGFYASKGDLLCNWDGGQVAPCAVIDGRIAIKVPYTKKTSEFDTGIDLPLGVVVHDVLCYSVVADASGTIEIGLLSSESGGDADGFLDVEALAATGWIAHNMVDATGSNNTLGVLLVETDIKSADGTALYYSVPHVGGHKCDGTAKSISYTTSNHTQSGYFYVQMSAPGLQIVGKAEATVDATAAAAALQVRCLI
jgi:hypothetical protein